MTTASSSLSASFNAFLFATAYEEHSHEMPVSVISALARLDLDPWAEAAELASMPVMGAVRRLSSLLARVAGGPVAQLDRESLAARLVGLLPTPLATHPKPGPGAGDVLASPYVRSLGILWLIMLAVMAASAWVGPPQPASVAHGAPPAPRPAAAPGR